MMNPSSQRPSAPGTDTARELWGQHKDPNFPDLGDGGDEFEIERTSLDDDGQQADHANRHTETIDGNHGHRPTSDAMAPTSPLSTNGVSRRGFMRFLAGAAAGTAASQLIAATRETSANDQANIVDEVRISLFANRRMSVAYQDLGYCDMLLSAAGQGFAPLAKSEDATTTTTIATAIERENAVRLASDAAYDAKTGQPLQEASSMIDKFKLACEAFQLANHKADPQGAPDAITDAQLILALGVAYDASAGMYDEQSQDWYKAFSALKSTQALIDYLSNNVATSPGDAVLSASAVAVHTATYATKQGLDVQFTTLGETMSADSTSILIGTTRAIGQGLRQAAELAGVHFLKHPEASSGK